MQHGQRPSDCKAESNHVNFEGFVIKESRDSKIFINPKFQWKFTGVMAIWGATLGGFTYLSQTYFQLNPTTVSLTVLCCTTLAGAIYSKKIAGPILKIKNLIIESTTDSPIEKVFFRKSDYFDELEDAVNAQIIYINDLRKQLNDKTNYSEITEEQGQKDNLKKFKNVA